jgi:hypothetical protein
MSAIFRLAELEKERKLEHAGLLMTLRELGTASGRVRLQTSFNAAPDWARRDTVLALLRLELEGYVNERFRVTWDGQAVLDYMGCPYDEMEVL